MNDNKSKSNTKNNYFNSRTQSTPQKKKKLNLNPNNGYKKTSEESTDKFKENLRVGKANILVSFYINIKLSNVYIIIYFILGHCESSSNDSI